MKSDKELMNELREVMIATLTKILSENGDEVLRVKGNKIAIPTIDSEKNERWVEITVATPTGERDSDEGYDGYAMAEDYEAHCEEVRKKAEEKEKEKQAKIALQKKKKEEAALRKAEKAERKELNP